MRPLRSLLTAALLGASLGITAVVALADPPRGGYPPDPAPIASKKQWTFDVVARDGKVSIEKARAATLAQPAETPRVTGRFAVELWVGRELLDRVRFNVPLMGDEAPQGNRNKLPRPRFNQAVTARVSARMADNPRAAFLLVIDRENGATQKLAWPPEPDGRLVPWQSGVTEGKPGDLPDGSVRAVGRTDGGTSDGGAGVSAPHDAGRD
jgi:hypothetical protein